MVLSLETINRGSKESFFMIVHRNFVRIWHSYASIRTKNYHLMTKRYIYKLQFATRYVIIDVDMKSFTCLYK